VGLTSDEIWHLANYVRSLPLEDLSRSMGPYIHPVSIPAHDRRSQFVARVTVRQFDWQVRYPGADGRLDTLDDVYAVNELHLPAGEGCEVALLSGDVRHRISLPAWGLRRTLVRGRPAHRLHLAAREAGQFPLMRDTQVGWGHPPVTARVIIQPRDEWAQTMERLEREQSVSSFVRGEGGQGGE
jgi:cytochrome c oxidase subunit 2